MIRKPSYDIIIPSPCSKVFYSEFKAVSDSSTTAPITTIATEASTSK